MELIIRRGEEGSAATFNALKASPEEIENSFGKSLSWEPLEGKKRARITKRVDGGGYRDPETEWPRIQEDMVEAMIRLETAFRPHIERLK